MTLAETSAVSRRSRPVKTALRSAEAAARLSATHLGLLRKEAARTAFLYAGGEAAEIREELYRECVQTGYAGLLRAAELFDETRGRKFSTYATEWILKFVRDAANDWAADRRHVSLDAPAGAEEGCAALVDFVADAAADPCEEAARADDAAFARDLLATLPERERLVVSMYHGIGGRPACTFAEIGNALGVSAQFAHRLYRRAMGRLRPAAA